jgi:hypothetical protein
MRSSAQRAAAERAELKRTSEDGYDGFVYRRDLLLLHHVAGEERYNEQHDRDEESP